MIGGEYSDRPPHRVCHWHANGHSGQYGVWGTWEARGLVELHAASSLLNLLISYSAVDAQSGTDECVWSMTVSRGVSCW